MRIIEIITIISVLAVIIERMLRSNRSQPIWEYAIVIPVVLQLIIIGARWQMYGIYFIVICIVLSHIKADIKVLQRHIHIKRWVYKAGIGITLLSLILLVLFPVTDLRKPIGPYEVGTMTYDLTDETRVELYGDRQGDVRKIRIQLWYPTDNDVKGSIAKWIEDGTVVPRGLMDKFNAPAFVYDHLALIDSNSYMDAPLNSDITSMPVVVISHGWTGFRNLHTDLGEMFASMGYLAISIDHTYGSVGLVFDDGESASTDPGALPDRGETDAFLTYAGNLVDTYSRDAGTVLEHLSYLNDQSEIFAGHIDLERVGVIGHSTGGGGVVKQAIENPMIDVVIGLDPWVEPIGRGMLSYGIKQPAMFFRSSSWTGGINEEYIKILTDNESADITKYEITGSKHQDFSMLYQMGPLPALIGISGKPKGYESADIQQAFIANFMNHWLLGYEDETESLMIKYELVLEVK